jgi:hypothetical protein
VNETGLMQEENLRFAKLKFGSCTGMPIICPFVVLGGESCVKFYFVYKEKFWQFSTFGSMYLIRCAYLCLPECGFHFGSNGVAANLTWPGFQIFTTFSATDLPLQRTNDWILFCSKS